MEKKIFAAELSEQPNNSVTPILLFIHISSFLPTRYKLILGMVKSVF